MWPCIPGHFVLSSAVIVSRWAVMKCLASVLLRANGWHSSSNRGWSTPNVSALATQRKHLRMSRVNSISVDRLIISSCCWGLDSDVSSHGRFGVGIIFTIRRFFSRQYAIRLLIAAVLRCICALCVLISGTLKASNILCWAGVMLSVEATVSIRVISSPRIWRSISSRLCLVLHSALTFLSSSFFKRARRAFRLRRIRTFFSGVCGRESCFVKSRYLGWSLRFLQRVKYIVEIRSRKT